MRLPTPPFRCDFDKVAYDVHASIRSSSAVARINLAHAERRDGVSWMESEFHNGAHVARISRAVLENLPPALKEKIWRIKINGLMSIRITGDPISFLANKTDHCIPEDCPVEFILVALKEPR